MIAVGTLMRAHPRLIAVLLAAGAAALFLASGGYPWLRGDGNVERLLTETGIVGPVAFVVVMWLTQPFGIPGFVYMAPAGLVWPDPLAIALAWVGNMGASYIAFSFARWFGRDWVSTRIPTRMRVYDDRLETGGLGPVIMLRLVFGQLPPADWMLGVTKVPTRTFLIGTGIGIIPGVVFFVVAGGGILDSISATPTWGRVIAVALLVAFGIGRQLIARARRRSSGAAVPSFPAAAAEAGAD